MNSADKQKILNLFAEGRRQYHLRDFVKAKDCFASALAIDREDGPSKVYYFRCQHYLQNPPAPDWDGVFTVSPQKIKR